MSIVIVDYGSGNLLSIANMLRKVGCPNVTISGGPDEIEKADKLILPGVGHIDHGMKGLRQANLIDVLNDKVIDKQTPVLGICLGLQLMTEKSEEGMSKGLGWLEATTIAFDKNRMNGEKLPHMGWAEIKYNRSHPLFKGLGPDPRFYFVHGYHVTTENKNLILCKADYGYDFTAGLFRENIMAVQFHPEKSHKFGMKIMKNFAEL
ncbi:MAG: imidazole glycerol phosphate synthase subunit HisH [Saprospiraceae bacterium]|nr:imidazole glycerol phosphate synthase subunit HisH [Saprospiraceae bacterium]